MSELTPAQEDRLPRSPSAYYETTAPAEINTDDFRGELITEHVAMLSRLNDGAAHATAEMWGNAAALYEATMAKSGRVRHRAQPSLALRGGRAVLRPRRRHAVLASAVVGRGP